MGFHAGADVGYFFSRHAGVGGTVRFSRGSVEMTEPLSEKPAQMTTGGMQFGGECACAFSIAVSCDSARIKPVWRRVRKVSARLARAIHRATAAWPFLEHCVGLVQPLRATSTTGLDER